MNKKRFLQLVSVLQLLLSLRVIWRLIASMGGEPIRAGEEKNAGEERVSVIVPVLNEVQRLSPCLEGLIAQGAEVAEIVVVDGGSDDGTQELVSSYSRKDARVRLVDASPIPASWNGKVWGLQVGLQSVQPDAPWVLTVDADVRPEVPLVRALLGRARNAHLSAFSVATLQELDSVGEGLLHPALLSTLVYRFGMPGKTLRRVSEVQANGQCFLFRRGVLDAIGGFSATRHSICEDVTIARLLVREGYRVGFYEIGSLARVKMYTNWRDLWFNWPRSLPMRDQFSGFSTIMGWLEMAFVQALPLPLLFFLLLTYFSGRGDLPVVWGKQDARFSLQGDRKGRPYHDTKRFVARMFFVGWAVFVGVLAWGVALFPAMVNSVLVVMRLGVLFGTARAYWRRPWSYWLSPLCDVAVVLWLGKMALQRRHTWRGRVILRDTNLV